MPDFTIEDIAISAEQVADLHEKQRELKRAVAKRRKQISEPFAMITLELAKRAGKVLHSAEHMTVLIHLLHHTTFSREPVLATTQAVGGVRRDVKLRALKLLEAAGVVEIEWRGNRSPSVTLHIGREPGR